MFVQFYYTPHSRNDNIKTILLVVIEKQYTNDRSEIILYPNALVFIRARQANGCLSILSVLLHVSHLMLTLMILL